MQGSAQIPFDAPFWQSTSFWGGIVVTAILSIPIGILANFVYYRLVSYLDSRKITSQQKSRKRALQFDVIINDLRAGRRDRYAYMLRMIIGILGGAVIAFTNISVGLAILALVPLEANFEIHQLRPILIIVVLFGASMFGVFIMKSATQRFRSISNALEKYDDYKADFDKRWGKDNQK